MAADAAVLAKPLLFIFGGLLAVIKALLIYVWVDNSKKVKNNSDEIRELKQVMDDKHYTREHVDLILHPIKKSIDKHSEVATRLDKTLHELSLKIERLR